GRYLTLLPLEKKRGLVHFFGLKSGSQEEVKGSDNPEDDSKQADVGHPPLGEISASKENGDPILGPRQVHSDRVRVHRRGEPLPADDPMGHDGVISDVPGLWLRVVTADCVPLLFYDGIKQVGGAVHAGWRGSLARISEKTLQLMQGAFGSRPEDVSVGIGPSIGPCCYEVGEEVIDALSKEFIGWDSWVSKNGNQKGYLDLRKMNRELLVQAGVLEDHIAVAGLCTYCQPELFFSYRRDGAGRGKMFSGLMVQKGSVW
ncbi:MAG: peptidoglycan editing factor PgeF, partial [Deltaproteobacteria bacterium]|nr:peptidoglycan editing factor PgeF [Deltaproteobacteria bacterium]